MKPTLVTVFALALAGTRLQAQIGTLNEIEAATDSATPQSTTARVTVLPPYLADPDGYGIPSSQYLKGNWDFEGDGNVPFNNKVDNTPLVKTGAASVVAGGVSKTLELAALSGAPQWVSQAWPSSGANSYGSSTNWTLSMWFKTDLGTVASGSYKYTALARFDQFTANPMLVTIGRQTVSGTTTDSVSLRSPFGYLSGTTLQGNAYASGPSVNSTMTGSSFILNYPVSGAGLGDNSWHHLVVVFNTSLDGRFSVYVDGVQLARTTLSLTANVGSSTSAKTVFLGHGLDFGLYGTEPTDRFTGRIDRARLYSAVLDGTATTGSIGTLMGQNVDGDSPIDRVEVNNGSNPLDPNSPAATPAWDDANGLATATANKTPLLARWDFETLDSQGRVSDLVGTNHLTLAGVALDNGKGMPSVSALFDGSGTMSRNTLSVGTLSNYSIGQWVRFDPGGKLATTTGIIPIWSLGGTANTTFAARQLANGSEIMMLILDGTSYYYWYNASGTRLSAGDWHHILVTRAANSAPRLWMDGVTMGSAGTYGANCASLNANFAPTSLTIGSSPVLLARLEGNIDQLRIWGLSLDETDARNLYGQDSDTDTIPDWTELLMGLNPKLTDSPPEVDPGWDQQGFGGKDVTSNLAAHWNFEYFKFDAAGRHFPNQASAGTYKMVPVGGVAVGFQNALAGNYASFGGSGYMESGLGAALANKTTWSITGWLKIQRDSIWEAPGMPMPLWELRDVVAGTQSGYADSFRLYAVRLGQFIQVFYLRFDPATGTNESTGTRWVLPPSVLLDNEGWHHLALQQERVGNTSAFKHSLYLDGALVPPYQAEAPVLTFTNTAATGTMLRIGSTFFEGKTHGFKGAWDRVRVYSASLPEATIAAMYDQDADGDSVSDINEYGIFGRSAIDGTDTGIPNPPGTDRANVDVEGVPPSLNNPAHLLDLWDFESLPDRATGFPDHCPALKAMVPGGSPEQSGMDPGVGMPSRSAFVKAGGFVAADASHFVGLNEFSTSLWVRVEPGLLATAPGQTVCVLSLENLQSGSEANTLSLRLTKSGTGEALFVQHYGTAGSLIQPVSRGIGWHLLNKRLDDGDWHHLVWVRRSTGSSVFLDGSLLSAQLANANELVLKLAKPFVAAAPSLVLGRISAKLPGAAISASYDRVRFYGKSLDEGEVRSLFKQDFDGDGFSDAYELSRFGYDPFALPGSAPNSSGGLVADWDDDTGLDGVTSLSSQLLGAWNFENSASNSVGDTGTTLRFPAQRPAGVGEALAQGGVQWNLEDGLLSRSLTMCRDGYISFPGYLIPPGTDSLSASFWVRMAKDEISSQAASLGGSPVEKKVGLVTFGTASDRLPHFVASLTHDLQLSVDTGFALVPNNTIGYSKTEMARWKLPAKLDDGRWHHVALCMGGNTSTVYVDGLPGNLATPNAGSFPPVSPYEVSSAPYLWLGFRSNVVLDLQNTITSALPYAGFSGTVDRVRFYSKALTQTDAGNLYFQDRDGDTIPDVTEANSFLRPLDADPVPGTADHDGDGLTKTQEISLGTDWRRPDSDGDWLSDGWEARYSGPQDHFVPTSNDSSIRYAPDHDGDTLNAWEEYMSGTNPDAPDTDGDGDADAAEIQAGSDPSNPGSKIPTVANHGPMTTIGVLPGGTYVPEAPGGGDPSTTFNGSDATGPRYRKVSLNGRPLADEVPEEEGETDQHDEEAFVDAFSLGLHLDHSLIHVPLGSSELTLQATLSYNEEGWNHRSGLRPQEKLTSPFGPCWTTNLCAYIEETAQRGGEADVSASPDPRFSYSVVDEDGRQLRFGSYDGISIFAYPSSLSDRKSYQHELRLQATDTLVLRKKFGTVLTYKLTELTQVHHANRDGQSGVSIRHRYFRLVQVEDRFGNQLRYAYPTTHNRTLIPTAIFDPKRAGQRIEITVDPGNPCRIASIKDPRGYSHTFGYSGKTVPFGSVSGTPSLGMLISITDPMSKTLAFDYSVFGERDMSDPSPASVTYYYAANLSGITNKRGSVTRIEYESDDDRFYPTVSGTQTTVKRVYGLPRLVRKVYSAKGAGDVEQLAEFTRRPGMAWVYSASGIKIYSSGAFATPVTDWTNEVVDGTGKRTTYRFRDVKAILADTNVHGCATTLNWLVYYLTMDIVNPDNIGTESYKFDLASGLSLRETVDLCGNSTYYTYGDAWGGLSLVTSDLAKLAVFGRWSDPTAKVDAVGRSEQYRYSPNFRVMSSTTDFSGTVKSYTVDRLGRKLAMTAVDASGTKLAEERYEYGDPRFPSFLTRKTVVAFASKSGQAWEQDLITLYEADPLGRISRQAVDMDRSGTINTGDLVSSQTYDLNNNKRSVTDPRGATTDFGYDPLGRLTRVRYPAAEGANRNERAESIFLYDAEGNKRATVDENGNVTITVFDSLNRVTSRITDMDGASLPTWSSLANNEGDTYCTLGSPGGKSSDDISTQYAYDDVNRVIRATDARGVVTATSYDSIGRRTAVWENYTEGDTMATFAAASDKRVTSYAYDKSMNCGGSVFAGDGFKPTTVTRNSAVLTAAGTMEDITTVTAYDKLYRPKSETVYYQNGSAATSLTDYDDTNLRVTVTTNSGETYQRLSRTQLDGLGRTIAVIADFGSGHLNATTTSHYSATGLVWKTTDAMGRETQTDYDAAARPIRVWNARGDLAPGDTGFGLVDRSTGLSDELLGSPVTETGYDSNGNAVYTVSPLGKRTDFTYDARNRKYREELPAVDTDGDSGTPGTTRPARETAYDRAGRVIAAKDARESWTRTFRDRAGRVWFIRTNPNTGNPSGVSNPATNLPYDIVTVNTYDKAGNVIAAKDPNGNITRNRYDALGRLTVTATNPETGNPADPYGTEYSAATIQASATATDIVVANTYDDSGNLVLVADGRGQQTAFRYDGLSRKTRVIWDPGTQIARTEEFNHDGAVLLNRKKADGRTISHTYDGLLRLKTVTYPADAQHDNRSMDYDLAGNLLSVTYPNAPATSQAVRQVSNTYDALNRVVSETSNGRTHNYTYDKAGNRRTVTYGVTGRHIASTYDALNRLETMTEKESAGATGGRITRYGYDLAGNTVNKKLPNDVVTLTTYDYLGRKLTITDKAGSVQLSRCDYSLTAGPGLPSGYDSAGNLCYSLESYSKNGMANRSVTNTYDKTSRLLTETSQKLSPAGTIVTTYEYDRANNRASKLVIPDGGPPTEHTAYNYGDPNASGSAHNSNQLKSFGPLGGSVTHEYTYDANGSRKTRSTAGRTDTYAYDDENRLVTLDFQTPADSTKRGVFSYTYDHRTRRVVRSELGIRTDLSFSGGASVQEWTDVQGLQRQYVRGSDFGGGIGGILYTLDSAAAPLFNLYNARGDVTGQTDAAKDVTWQAAYEAFGARVQSQGTNPHPQKANTKDEDPTGLLNEGMRYRDLETGSYITRDPAGFVDGPNVYTYVNQNPWSKFDPDGLWSWSSFGKGLVTGIVVAAAVTAVVVAAPAVLAAGAVALGASAATAATVSAVAATTITVAGTAATVYSAPTIAAEVATLATGDEYHGSWSGGFENKGTLSDEAYSEKAGNFVGGLAGGAWGMKAGSALSTSAKSYVTKTVATRAAAAESAAAGSAVSETAATQSLGTRNSGGTDTFEVTLSGTRGPSDGVKWGRKNTVGSTPGKDSSTGKQVIDRLRKSGDVIDDPIKGTMFKDSKGVFRPIKGADMTHKTDAVSWWNKTGRQYGAKAPEVRKWMKDPDNYTLDFFSNNRSAGARLRQTYKAPLK